MSRESAGPGSLLPKQSSAEDLAGDRLSGLNHWEADWAGLRVVVTGIGKSGFSIADTLAELGARVIVVAADDDETARQAARTLRIAGVEEVRLGEEVSCQLPLFPEPVISQTAQNEAGPGTRMLPAELVVTSPGLPPRHPLLAAAAQTGIPIWGDIELAWRVRRRQGRRVAEWMTITGTNGKTTTTAMLASILQAAGLRAIAVGNIGTPILDAVREPEGYDVLAVELSTFQLHWTSSVSPLASVCLNLAEDHMDWHGSFEAYAADKARVYQNTRVACVYNAEQIETERMVESADVVDGCRAVAFTTNSPAISMIGVVDGLLVDRAFIAERRTTAAELAPISVISDLAPRHLVANAAAAATLARAYGVEATAVRDGLSAYESGAHRIQAVARRDGVLWVNDSKATNPHAASASLAAFRPIIWIAGGEAKGVAYDELVARHASRLKTVVLIGRDRSALRSALKRHAPDVPVIDVSPSETKDVHGNAQGLGRGSSAEDMMARAVATAAQLATDGDTVLLAPAAASIDQFSSYAHRGESFIEAVRALMEELAESGVHRPEREHS